MKCQDCRFWHNEGDGFGDCAADKHTFHFGDVRVCGFDALVIGAPLSPRRHIIMGGDYGCVHAEPRNIGGWSERMQQLMDAIGRHPAAESDPDVIDAMNAVGDDLRQKEVGT